MDIDYSSLKTFNLGVDSRVVQFIKRELTNGQSLSRQILKLWTNSGYATVDLPTQFEDEWVFQFDRYVVKSGPTNKRLADQILEHLQANDHNCAIFEDPCSKDSDPIVQEFGDSLLSYNNEIYHYLGWHKFSTNAAIVERMQNIPCRYPFVGILTSFPAHFQFGDHLPSVRDDVFLYLVEKAIKIIIGAYDGTGFIIWHWRRTQD